MSPVRYCEPGSTIKIEYRPISRSYKDSTLERVAAPEWIKADGFVLPRLSFQGTVTVAKHAPLGAAAVVGFVFSGVSTPIEVEIRTSPIAATELIYEKYILRMVEMGGQAAVLGGLVGFLIGYFGTPKSKP